MLRPRRDCYPLLLLEVQRLAETMGDARLFVNLLPGDAASAQLWRRLGFRPGSVMARRPVRTWHPVGPPPSGVTVRVARPTATTSWSPPTGPAGSIVRWIATQGADTAFLHYLADNPLSSRFWARARVRTPTSRSTRRSAGAEPAGARDSQRMSY